MEQGGLADMEQAITAFLEGIARRADSSVENLDRSLSLEQLGVDSLTTAELLVEFESILGVEVPDDTLEAFQPEMSVQAVIELMRRIDPVSLTAFDS